MRADQAITRSSLFENSPPISRSTDVVQGVPELRGRLRRSRTVESRDRFVLRRSRKKGTVGYRWRGTFERKGGSIFRLSFPIVLCFRFDPAR